MIMMVIMMIKARRRGLAQAGTAIGSWFSLEIEEHPRFHWAPEHWWFGSTHPR